MNSRYPRPSPRIRPNLFSTRSWILLDERDREAVLLHFFEGHSFAEVGGLLSLSADAARMRVNRALEKLRSDFAPARSRLDGRGARGRALQRNPPSRRLRRWRSQWPAAP